MAEHGEEKVVQDYFNIVLIGDENVGKTCILDRYCNNKFSFTKKKQKSIEIYKKQLELNDTVYKLKLWDTQFNDSYFKLNKQIYDRADCIILVCAVNNRDSFTDLNTWYQTLCDNIDTSNKNLVIIANKNDLEEERVVGVDEIRQKAEELGMDFYEMSALENQNVEDSFESIIEKVVTTTYNNKQSVTELKADENNNSSRACQN